jgi:hypothetical protein
MRYLIALVASLLVLVAAAIEAPKPEKKPSDPATKTEQPAPESATLPTTPAPEQPQAAAVEEEEEEEELPPLPADTAPAGPPPARFNPTEKVRADFPVSFPIDI